MRKWWKMWRFSKANILGCQRKSWEGNGSNLYSYFVAFHQASQWDVFGYDVISLDYHQYQLIVQGKRYDAFKRQFWENYPMGFKNYYLCKCVQFPIPPTHSLTHSHMTHLLIHSHAFTQIFIKEPFRIGNLPKAQSIKYHKSDEFNYFQKVLQNDEKNYFERIP